MARYIEEEAFVEFVQKHFCEGCNNYGGVKCRSCSVADAISMVESAPTAEVVAKVELDAMRGAANSYKMHYEGAIKEYRQKVYSKMGKYTVFGREYIQRIMREVENEMVGNKDV